MKREDAEYIVGEIAKEYGLSDAQKEHEIKDYMQRDIDTLEYLSDSLTYINNCAIIGTLPKFDK